MNNNKYPKPNLLDPIMCEKIIKTLNPPPEDYWAPTKNSFQSFYQNFNQTYEQMFLIIKLNHLIYETN